MDFNHALYYMIIFKVNLFLIEFPPNIYELLDQCSTLDSSALSLLLIDKIKYLEILSSIFLG